MINDDIEFPGVDPVIHDDIKIPGVDDVEGLQDPNPQEIEIDDLNIYEPDPAPIDIETVQEATI